MTQKIVTFEVAKALKDAGYPQVGRYQYTYTGELVDLVREGGICYGQVAPSYLDAWLWLWRVKKIYIEVNCIQCSEYNTEVSIWHEYGQYHYECKFTDPEEAIAKAIEYLVTNNLIK